MTFDEPPKNQRCFEMKLRCTPIEKNDPNHFTQIPGLSTPFISTSLENQKYKTKVYLPHNTGINYVGLLIGPKGIY